MMTQYTPFIVLVGALLMNTLSCCSAENVYCVTPTATSCSSCPHNTYCTTLSEYAREAELYFTSNTTMVFLSGDHTLDKNITVSNVTRLTMRGESSSGNRTTVVCSGSVGLSFTSMVEFKIDSLAFTSCSRKYVIALPDIFPSNIDPPDSATLVHVALLLHSTHAELVNCSFHDNLGTALVVNNTNITLSGNTFIHNNYYLEEFVCGSRCMRGGAVTAVHSNLIFTGNTTFLENSAIYTSFSECFYWGAILTYINTIINFNGTSNFINNSADSGAGGAIVTYYNTIINFNGASNFINNSADSGAGGAIVTYYNTIINFNGASNFINNSADSNGGAILTYDNTIINFIGTSNFINNSAGWGGAIYTFDNTIINFNGTSNFISNSADWGGAIYTFDNTIININGTSNFINNSADLGGAIYTFDNTIININGTSNFINNSADSGAGGAIFIYNNTIINFNGTNNFINNSADSNGGAILTYDNTIINFIGTSNFINNSADWGGAIHTYNNTLINFNGTSNFINNSAGWGGAIYTFDNTIINFNGTSNFISNSADWGGAIYTFDNTIININGTSNFINNSADSGAGGAIFIYNNTIINFNGTNNFINNSADSNGGAILTYDNTIINFIGTSNFINNSADWGGAIHTYNNTLINFNGTSNFINNSAGWGGAIYTFDNTIINFNGTSNFISNSADWGGAIYTFDNTIININGTSNFINNSADSGAGGAIFIYNNTIINFNGTNNFINNSADGGGAIHTYNTIINFNGTSNFINNSADYDGGAIFTNDNTLINFNGTSNFINNSAGLGGGAILTYDNTTINFNGTSNFINNSADRHGGAIFTYDNTIINFNGTSNFINNSAVWGGAVYTNDNTLINFNGTSNFINNSADSGGAILTYDNTIININGTSNFINNSADSNGGAICANTNITLTFSRTVNFTNNVAMDGGGVYLGLKSTVSIFPNTTVYWENNHAYVGGAIFVVDASPISYCTPVAALVPKEECFFQHPGQNLSSDINVKFVFKNNSADDAGSVLYGGAIDNCKLTDLDSHSSGEVFDMIVHIDDDNDYNTTSNISSDPLRICPCENNLPNCSKHNVSHTVYPGETFQVSVVAVGQRNGTVSSEVISTIVQTVNQGHLPDSQYLQKTNSTCTKLNYTVFSLSQFVEMDLYAAHNPCPSNSGYILLLSVKLNQTCPPGFNILKSTQSCVCEPKLQRYTNSCTITNGLGTITRDSSQQFWVGYDNQSDELILHPLCPFDYCVNDTVVFPLNNTDSQCANNRSGLLCGACKESYSLILGTSRCEKCTNSHLVLLIPFAVMGVALVFFLLVCKLTVATGMLSGLVFYANIIGVNRNIFLPVECTNLFSIFIAWLNFDFGIETCFYNGMDAYSKTWLQFVFPVYIWVLVGLMILVSHFSHKFARLLGNNPVSVLATLILLSYTKILRTLIAVFYITYLEYPTYNRSVWLYDANVDYLVGKHIPFFIVAVLVFLFLFLPYTLLLLFGQWLQAISHLRLFSWVNSARLKPFMDSYHAPYKAKHRYWPGLLLVLRFVLLLVFALNLQEEHSINLLAILVTTGFVVAMAWLGGGIYRNWCLDALECSFALNLIILAAATYHVNHSKQNQLVVGYTSVSIAFATFIGIFVFQLANATGITQSLKQKCRDWKLAVRNPEPELRSPTDSLPDRLINPEEYEQPFHTPQQHASAEPTEGANGEQRKLMTPVYTYGSID